MHDGRRLMIMERNTSTVFLLDNKSETIWIRQIIFAQFAIGCIRGRTKKDGIGICSRSIRGTTSMATI